MYYLVRMDISDPFFWLDLGDRQLVFLDHREFGVFEEQNKNPRVECVLLNPLFTDAQNISGDGSLACKLALSILQRYDLVNATIEVPAYFPLDMADYLRGKGVQIKIRSPFFPARAIKSAQEVVAIRESLHRTHAAFECVERMLRESTIQSDTIVYRGEVLTSERIKQEVERIMLDRDLVNTDGIIISCGAHAAIPHHPGSGPLRPHQTIVCDIFPRHRASGYYADMTRTYVKGSPSPDITRMYDAVRTAQERAITAVRDGARTAEIHALCVDAFETSGFYTNEDGGFLHATGHGLGLDVHEAPAVTGGSPTTLTEGNVITIEPGLYYPELGGVRLEDVVHVTVSGCENLTQYDTPWIIP